jgi:DNA polymerase-3 subunit alpha
MSIPVTGLEHLHLHTDFSLLDGFGMVEEYTERWKKHGRFLCISDHGMMGAVPRQIKACEAVCEELKDKNAFSPIFACELYVNRYHTEATPDVASREKLLAGMNPDEKAGFKVRGSHLLAIAYNEVGYSNLVRMTTWAYLNGFYGKPRVNYEQLLKHKEGLIFTSCCYNSEIGRAFEYGGTSYEEKRDAAAVVIERYIQMFGSEYFYLEIMLLDFEKQKPYDKFIIWAADKYKLRLIVTNDCHYCLPEDSEYQRLMLMQQTGKTIKDIQKALNEEGIKDLFELQDQNLWMKTEEELNDMWVKKYSDTIDLDIFQCAKANTVKICEMCKGVKLDRRNKLPKLKNAEDELQTHILNGFKERHIVGKHYKARAAQEYELICRKGFASYFLIQKKMVDEARRYYRDVLKLGSGYEAVGPGRGSAVGALTCYLLGITDVDPVEEDLLFDRFLSDSRGGRQIKLRFSNIDPIITKKEEAA